MKFFKNGTKWERNCTCQKILFDIDLSSNIELPISWWISTEVNFLSFTSTVKLLAGYMENDAILKFLLY